MVRKASGAEAAPRRRHRTALQLHSALGGARRGRAATHAAPTPHPPPHGTPRRQTAAGGSTGTGPQAAAMWARQREQLRCPRRRARPRWCARTPHARCMAGRPRHVGQADQAARPIPTHGPPATPSPGEPSGEARQSWQTAARIAWRQDPACSGPGMRPPGAAGAASASAPSSSTCEAPSRTSSASAFVAPPGQAPPGDTPPSTVPGPAT